MICKGDYLNSTNLKTPNSQIIIVNSCDDLTVKKATTETNFDGVSKPDDDVHLTPSPSLVNLAKLGEHNDYLVPLSSWERPDHHQSASNLSTQFTQLQLEEIACDNSDINENKVDDSGERLEYRRRSSLARRISNFFRKHWRRSKTLPEPHDYQLDDNKTTEN